MAESFYKMSHPSFVIWVGNMLSVLEENKETLGVDDELIESLKEARASLASGLDERQTLEDSLSGKNREIKSDRENLNKAASRIQGLAKLNAKIPAGLVEQLGFGASRVASTSSTPTQPLDLVATGSSDGINRLKWSRNGNRQGVMFVIEAKTGEAGEWTIVDVVTNSKFDHKNQTPGARVQYRVKAKRGTIVSSASNIAIVYS